MAEKKSKPRSSFVGRWRILAMERMSGLPGKFLIGIGGWAGEEATVFNRAVRGPR